MTSLPWLFVMAGGSGTRFWPRSRAKHPKQLLKFSGKTLLAITLERFVSFIPEERVVVICTKRLKGAMEKELKDFKGTVLWEPEGKNTAPCLTMAMEWLRHKDPQGIAIVVPADHWIVDTSTYIQTLESGVRFVKKFSQLLTIGVTPTRKETGYGYIRCGKQIEGELVCRVERFVEKPPLEVVETIVQDTSYLWNTGMLIWSVNVFFEELEKIVPELATAFLDYRKSIGKDEEAILEKVYSRIEAISIEYALMEKSKCVAVLPAGFDWNDLGSFQSLYELYPEVEGGVGYAKRIMAIDSTSNLVDCPGKTVALLGSTNMMIIDTGDVLLVATKEKSQDIKKFVTRLREEKEDKLL